MAWATSYEVAFGFAPEFEFLCREQVGQAVEKHQNDGHGHDDHIVADATGEKETLEADMTHTGKSRRSKSCLQTYT